LTFDCPANCDNCRGEMSENLTSVSKQYHVLVSVYNIGQAVYKKGGKSKTKT
jgi:hypothetical protein